MDKMKKVKWLKNALKQLNNEVKYISIDNKEVAQDVAASIRKTVKLLETMPLMGRCSSKRKDIRLIVIPGLPYIVFYRLQKDTIQIIRIFHTSRRLVI